MAEKIHESSDIIKYLEEYKSARKLIDIQNQSLAIKIKPPNLSEEVSESLACKLINDGLILSTKYGLNSIAERFGKTGVDILVNNTFKIECKGTTSLNGFVSVSKTNLFERDAWIWLDFQSYIRKDSTTLLVHIIHSPNECIIPIKIEANGENKITMSSAIKNAIKLNHYEYHDFDIFSILK